MISFDAEQADRLIIAYLDSDTEHKNEELEKVFEVVRPFVAALVERSVEAADREDATQEIAIHLERVLPRYNRDKASLRAWISTIVGNKVVSLYRHKVWHGGPEIADVDIEEVHAEEDGGIERFTDALEGWLVNRYPSLMRSELGPLAETIVTSLVNSRSVKASVAAIHKHDKRLTNADALQVYDGALVFLRMISYSRPVSWANTEQEFSLVPELRLLLGDTMFAVFYTLFRGTHIEFRDRKPPLS